MTLTEHLADMGMGRACDAISPAAYAAARKLLLDTLGCLLAGHREPGVKEAARLMLDWGGKPEAAVLLHGARAPMPNAAFANSVMIHALDYDDVYIPACALHITSMIVPAMLAAAEVSGASGREALAAMLMGIEVSGRLGIVERQHRRTEAFLATTLDCGFGAVVTAARLLGLSRAQCVDAMGINYAQVSGNRQALRDMTLTKRIQPALGTRSALWAVELARCGITGPPRALEGEAGFFAAYLDGGIPDPDALVAPKDWFEAENTAIKPYPSCGASHPAQEAAEMLARDENLKADDIDRVEVFGPYLEGGIVGQPFAIGRTPQVDAQFSVRYAVAFALLRGRQTIADLTDAAVRANTDVAALAQAIPLVAVPDDVPNPFSACPPDYPPYTGMPFGVIVHTHDGRRLVRARSPGQTFEAISVTFDDVIPKFRECAGYSGVCDTERAEAIVETVRTLDAAPSVRALLAYF
jgi:2-methylcitrate dehydratase PrpD